MMTDRELMQQALSALVTAELDGNCEYGVTDSLRARLAQTEQEPVAWMYINKIGGRQVFLMEPPQELKKDYYALYMAQPKPQLAQRNGNCLLTGVCAAEGHRITKEKLDQKPVVWMYQDKSTNKVKFQKEMRAFVDHGATYEVPLYAAPQPEEVPYDPRKNNKDYERGFIDGMQHQMKSSVDIAVNAMANQQKTSGSLITEPVGRFAKFTDGIWKEVTDGSAGQPLYTAPPQREWMEQERAVGYREGHQAALKQRVWQGLTDHEIWKDDGIMAANSGYGATFETLRELARAIEAKLREKNG